MDIRDFRSDLTSFGFYHKLLSSSHTSHIQVAEIPVWRVIASAVRWKYFDSRWLRRRDWGRDRARKAIIDEINWKLWFVNELSSSVCVPLWSSFVFSRYLAWANIFTATSRFWVVGTASWPHVHNNPNYIYTCHDGRPKISKMDRQTVYVDNVFHSLRICHLLQWSI